MEEIGGTAVSQQVESLGFDVHHPFELSHRRRVVCQQAEAAPVLTLATPASYSLGHLDMVHLDLRHKIRVVDSEEKDLRSSRLARIPESFRHRHLLRNCERSPRILQKCWHLLLHLGEVPFKEEVNAGRPCKTPKMRHIPQNFASMQRRKDPARLSKKLVHFELFQLPHSDLPHLPKRISAVAPELPGRGFGVQGLGLKVECAGFIQG